MRTEKIVVVSGGVDPFHIGHLNLVREASKLGDKLIFILNNDNWLISKKGYVFMKENERAEIMKSIKYVDDVMITKHKKNDSDKSVCRELEVIRPAVFANGGDRKSGNIPEYALCEKLDIKMIFGVGGGKVRHSSKFVQEFIDNLTSKCVF